MSLTLGEVAPDFDLPATNEAGRMLLHDLRGQNVVIAFYPFDWSPVCSLQLPTYQQDITQFEAANTQLLAISRDSLYSHRAFAERLGLTFPLLSDRDGSVSVAYGVLRPDGKADRAVFLLDKAGVLRFKQAVDSSQQPDYDELLIELEKLVNSSPLEGEVGRG